MKKRNIDGYFINTYYDENGVDFMRACWILNGRYYSQYYDAKTDTTHKIKRISERNYISEYEYKNNL